MLHILVQIYGTSALICTFLLVFIQVSNTFDRKVNRDFTVATVLVLMLICVEAAENWQAALSYPTVWHSLFTGLAYSLRPFVGYRLCIICYHHPDRRTNIMTCIPAIVNVIVCMSGLICNLPFFYDANNQFHRGALNFVPFLVGFWYMFMLMHRTVTLSKERRSAEGIVINFVACLTLAATFLESKYYFEGLISDIMACSLLFYYMFFHANQNNHDLLTQALIRRRFFQDTRKNQRILTAIISIDLNDLKQLNDEVGHNEGDEALVTLSNIVMNILSTKQSFYRTGGDEFMILCYQMDEASVKETIQRIREAMNETTYSCAIGYAMYDLHKTIDEVCLEADKSMYSDKIEIKGEAYRTKYRTACR